jgi:hypothetical protein
MVKQKWFKREILERFMDEESLEIWEKAYREAKIVSLGRQSLEKKKNLPF